ncbi:MAG TPA: toll/interleukin-1 receptor domain-containing protein [Thermoanaerobaculia bacterium]|nr:toll/interleukin-1 receptor domain-containing protein [Thermoanaerobaculia bacterium]
MSTSTRPTVFLSYSHRDETWKDRVVGHLNVLHRDVLEVWDDRRIATGDDWLPAIQSAMDRAAVALLLISKDFLTSGFIQGTEVPHLLTRRREKGLRVIPLFVHPCAWQAVPWLAAIQGRPKDAKPLSEHRKPRADRVLAELTLEIWGWLAGDLTPYPPLPSPDPPTPGKGERISGGLARTGPHASPLSRRGTAEGRGGRRERGTGGEVRLDLGRLPIAGPLLIGRDSELALLDAAWDDPGLHVLTFVAFGGMGKSALVSHWLDRMAAAGWRGAQRVLDWSFYSQGTEERVTSADRFLDYALAWFGDPDPKAGAPRDRGLRLAELVRRERTLLVLDGVEPLQHPPSSPLAGRLKDPGLAALLKGLAAGNPGLCVVTTRERIADLESFQKTAPQGDLEALSPEAGAKLLGELGVKGKDSELLAASKEFGNHALTLTLLGGYLSRACGGDVRRRKEVDLAGAAERKGGHALRVIGTYADWLGEGPELAALRLLGLFDRPAQPKALAALRAKPAIQGLTEPLMDLGEEAWQLALSSLREHGLLLPADPQQPGTLDAHPLVRVFFQEELEKKQPEAWQAGNLRLYEHLQKEAQDLPETLEDMEPLYSAVIHGCRAGRQQEAFDEIYWRRIRRGNEMYSLRKLGAFGSDLSALSGFFDRPWDQPSTSLTSADQALLLNEAGFELRAVGRLAEAVQPMEAGLGQCMATENWKTAAITAGNLSELTLTLGEVERAVAFGKQSVDLADRMGGAFQRMGKRTTLADALHQAGRWEESAEAFREAEALQAEDQPDYPRLYSLRGYLYCDLLLSRGEPEDGTATDGLAADPEASRRFCVACREVRERAEQTLQWAKQNRLSLLAIALDHLSLGRAHLGLALTAPRTAPGEEAEADLVKAAEHLNHAVEGLRRAGQEHYFPLGLLARAALRRLRNQAASAEADLSEALEIAERGSMRLHECDTHLEWARLCRQRGDRDGLERHVTRARRLVEETGYERRRREVEWLEKALTPVPSPR